MTPQEILDRLKGIGLIDPAVLEKIRLHVEDPKKEVKPKAILSYLVKKQQITRAQAAALLKEINAPKPIKHEEIEVTVPAEKAYDTDDLTSTVREITKPPPKPSPKVDPQRTLEAVPVDDEQDDPEEVDVVPVEPLSPTREVEPLVDLVDPVSAGHPMPDPLDAGPLDAGYPPDIDGGPYAETPAQKTISGFQGKRLKKDQWATRWLYIGFGILGSLLIFGAVLYIAVNRVSAEDQFKAAMASFENGSFADAIDKFNQFIEDNPSHEKVNTVKVRRVQALIAQTYESRNWDETISRAEAQLPALLDDPEIKMDLIRDDLGVMLPGAALRISERALKQTNLDGMETQLALAEKAKSVVDNAAYIPNSIRKRPIVAETLDKLENNILSVKGLIQKENDYAAGLTQIKQLGEAGKTQDAFGVYQKLIRQYGELATREQLQVAMKAISAKETELVKPLTANVNVASGPRPSDAQDVVVLFAKHGSPIEANLDIVTPVLAEGTLYGIESSDGSVVWRKWLGFQTLIQPQLFDEDRVLVCDQLHQDVMLIKRSDGAIVWRTEIGEPFVRPVFNETTVVVTATAGKVFKLDAQTGQVVAAVQLPQPANVSAMIAEREPYIYQPGYYSNIYILAADDLSCRDVYYLGHYQGSIEVPIQYWNGHLLVCVNGGNRCDLHILRSQAEGIGLELIQLLNRVTAGPVTTPLQRFGRWMLVAADNGDLRILNIDPSEEANPISKFADEKFENRGGHSAFLLTEGSQLWIAGKGLMKYRIQGSLGKFTRQVITNHGDDFIAPLQTIEQGLLHVRRREGSGMISVSAVEPNTLKPIWRTDLGGSLAGAPRLVGDQLHAVTNQGDLFVLGQEAFDQGFSDAAVKSSTVVENLVFERMLRLDDDRFACIGPVGRDDLLLIQDGNSRLMKLQPPANRPACPPIAVGGDLIVPASQGPVARVDAATGRMVGAPFQPPVQPGVDILWKTPTLVEGQIFAIAKAGGEQGQSSVFLLDASDGKSIRKLAGIEPDSEIKSPLTAFDRTVVLVMGDSETDQLVTLNAEDSLSTTATTELPGQLIAGPWVVGESVLVAIDSDELLCFDRQLNPKWKTALPQDQFAAEPAMDRGNIALAFRSGQLVWLNPDSGEPVNSIALRQPVSEINFSGDQIYFGGMDGTVHSWQPQ